MTDADDDKCSEQQGFSSDDDEEEEEELEYSVQFAGRLPSNEAEQNEGIPEESTSGEGKSSDEVQSIVKEKEPVVFLIGWADCMDRHLAKYSNMYASAGVTAIRYRPKFRHFFITPEDMNVLKKQAQKFVELTSDLDLEDHPIFFHVFSNNGVAFYSEVVEIILNNTKFEHLKVHGAILDSCPGQPRLSTLVRYSIQSSRLQQLSLYHTILRLFCSLFYAIVSPLTYLILGWTHRMSLAKRDRSEHWPVYYLYSDSDKLVPFQDVEYSIRHRSSNGLPVGSHRFNSSVHVAHYQKYPEEYANHCLTFMKNCLSQ